QYNLIKKEVQDLESKLLDFELYVSGFSQTQGKEMLFRYIVKLYVILFYSLQDGLASKDFLAFDEANKIVEAALKCDDKKEFGHNRDILKVYRNRCILSFYSFFHEKEEIFLKRVRKISIFEEI